MHCCIDEQVVFSGRSPQQSSDAELYYYDLEPQAVERFGMTDELPGPDHRGGAGIMSKMPRGILLASFSGEREYPFR